MNSCLKGYIGVKGCGQAVPVGGYINMLPGVSLKSIQGIANSEQETYVRVWDDIQDRAWMRFESDFRNKLRAKFNIKTVNGNYALKTIDTGSTNAAEAKYAGLLVDAGIDENGLFAFDVTSISFNAHADQQGLNIYVFDRQGNELDMITANITAGLNTIAVNKRYSASLVFICVDTTGLVTKHTTVTEDREVFYNYLFQAFGDCCRPIVSGAVALPGSLSRPGYSSNSYGLSAVISPVCDFSVMVCRNKEQFKNAWVNLLGAELMTETLFSERTNYFTLVKGDDAAQLRDLFTGQYENALDDVVKGIRINEQDDCIECAQRITRVERLP